MTRASSLAQVFSHSKLVFNLLPWFSYENHREPSEPIRSFTVYLLSLPSSPSFHHTRDGKQCFASIVLEWEMPRCQSYLWSFHVRCASFKDAKKVWKMSVREARPGMQAGINHAPIPAKAKDNTKDHSYRSTSLIPRFCHATSSHWGHISSTHSSWPLCLIFSLLSPHVRPLAHRHISGLLFPTSAPLLSLYMRRAIICLRSDFFREAVGNGSKVIHPLEQKYLGWNWLLQWSLNVIIKSSRRWSPLHRTGDLVHVPRHIQRIRAYAAKVPELAWRSEIFFLEGQCGNPNQEPPGLYFLRRSTDF